MDAARLLLTTLGALSALIVLLGTLGLRRHSKRLQTFRLVLLAAVVLLARDTYTRAAEIKAQEAIDSYDDFIAVVVAQLPGLTPTSSTTTTTTP